MVLYSLKELKLESDHKRKPIQHSICFKYSLFPIPEAWEDFEQKTKDWILSLSSRASIFLEALAGLKVTNILTIWILMCTCKMMTLFLFTYTDNFQKVIHFLLHLFKLPSRDLLCDAALNSRERFQEWAVSSQVGGMLGVTNLLLLVLPARGLRWVGRGCMCSPEYETIKMAGSVWLCSTCFLAPQAFIVLHL